MRYAFPLSNYREAAAFSSREAGRYYLQGVKYEPTAGVLVGTDGHVLAAVKIDPESHCPATGEDRILPIIPEMMKAKLTPALRRLDLPLWLVLDQPDQTSGRIVAHAVAASDAQRALELPHAGIVAVAVGELIDGTFPDWRRVLKQPEQGQSPIAGAAFDARLLVRIVAAFPQLMHATMRLRQYVDGEPAFVDIEGRPDVLIVCMPMRHTLTDGLPVPAWAAK